MEFVAEEQLRLIDGILTETTLKNQELRNKLYMYDMQVQDLEHIIEAVNFSASEGYKLAKRLQAIKRERRVIKDNIEVFKAITSNFSQGSLTSAEKEMKDKIRKINKRGYLVKGLSKSADADLITLLDRADWKNKCLKK